MGRLFGTDGVRGVANRELTAELALDLAESAAAVLADRHGVGRPLVVVGRDTRPSGEFLEAAVCAGLACAGVDVARLGVVPTPTVAHAVAGLGADAGVVISASHNPMADNGIKLFGRGGAKLPDDVEAAIEAGVGSPHPRPVGVGVGRVHDEPGAVTAYVDSLLASLAHPLDGLRVVVDCAQGAASTLSPQVLRKAGADVVAIFADGDGTAINDGCGATHLAALQAAVVAERADVGIAHDGDADRCLAVAATGEVVDGDQILAVCALALRQQGRLVGDRVVATVMANLGFRQAMAANGVGVVETPVGDRHVLAAMRRDGLVLGGEQSGHLVFLDRASTGDGLLTALALLAEVARSRVSLAELATVMKRLPQVLVNVRLGDRVDRGALLGRDDVALVVAQAEATLGAAGRVLVRLSGTEPLARVMVEAPTVGQAQSVADGVAAVLRAV